MNLTHNNQNTESNNYHPEKYWDSVAIQVQKRNDGNILAGDDEPYYNYKRKKFLKILRVIPFMGKKVIEVGSGPGGNLVEVYKLGVSELWGTDVSQKMLDISARINSSKNIGLKKTNGTKIDFQDNYFDVAFTSTVLQHNVNEEDLYELITEICRITKSDVYIFERTEKKIKGNSSNVGRPVQYYQSAFAKNGYEMKEVRFLHIEASYLVCGAIRKLFNSKRRREGEPITKISDLLERLALPITRLFDKIIPGERDLTMIHFSKTNF